MLLSSNQSWSALSHTPSQLENPIELLRKSVFRDSEELRSASTPNIGLTGGLHQDDLKITVEKNKLPGCLWFGVRVDTHRPSAAEKKAITARCLTVKGEWPSKEEKSEAKAMADAQIIEGIKAGRYRHTAVGEVLWRPGEGLMLISGLNDDSVGMISALLKSMGVVGLARVSFGMIAEGVLGPKQLDSLRSNPYVKRNALEGQPVDPCAEWLTKGYSLFDFIGCDFMFWLLMQNEMFRLPDDRMLSHTICNVLDVRCPFDELGSAKFKNKLGNPMALADAKRALLSGKWPTSAGLMLSDGQAAWSLVLSAMDMKISQCQSTDDRFDDVETEAEMRSLQADAAFALQTLVSQLFTLWLSTVRMANDVWPDFVEAAARRLEKGESQCSKQ